LSVNPDVIAVGLGYLFHEMKYKFNSLLKETIVDETIPLAITGGKVMDDFEKDFGKPLYICKLFNQAALSFRLALVIQLYARTFTF